ncbi:uncharacterized protein LOC131227113 [Magnolia sinica]|uniref:uncharacterized protein LOC131227113 n=1 Tax=Magnolia sinica TaxID=86752 RepID=UPI0026597E09|nr:uncharacterized protein LOC131227113 [Magnolia sinica]
MPSLDIATSQSSFRDYRGASRVHIKFSSSPSDVCAFGKEKSLASAWTGCIRIPRKPSFNAGHLEMRNTVIVNAVVTFEPKYLVQSEDGHTQDCDWQSGSNSDSRMFDSLSEDSSEMDEKERLRRMRISKANKGNVPWNKGRKHSAETLRRIRERTKLAMQDPKVKMKLVNLGHAQSEETRVKIGLGVRMGWQRRRGKLMIQEKCHLEWQNLIAEASRKGYEGEDELQWDSYKILDKQLEEEWLESVERRKLMPRPKGSKRAPKSPEQRRKISEAISAKWADPGYRDRVCSALSKYHGTPVGAERKPRRKPTGETLSVRRSATKRRATDWYNSTRAEGRSPGKVVSRKKSNVPSYKDPLAKSKLEMIKKIREDRAAIETKKREATERAKLLIAEAEKAAKALEVAAMKSPLARASLMETRKLIAEATRSIESIETGQFTSSNSQKINSFNSNGSANHFHEERDTEISELIPHKREVNGTHLISSSNNNHKDFNLDKYALKLLNGSESLPAIQSAEGIHDYFPPQSHPDSAEKQLGKTDQLVDPPELNGAGKCEIMPCEGELTGVVSAREAENSSSDTASKKKWVCGRLVDVAED